MIKQARAYKIKSPTKFESIGDLFGTILPNVHIIAGLLLFFYLIYGGFQFLTAGGNEDSIEAARKTITNAIVGMVIIFTSYWVMWILQTIFGVPLLFE